MGFSHVFTCFHYVWDMGKLFRTHGLVSGVLTRWGCGLKQGNLPQGQLRFVGWSSKYTYNCDCFVGNYPIVIRITVLLQETIYKEVKSFHPQNHLNSAIFFQSGNLSTRVNLAPGPCTLHPMLWQPWYTRNLGIPGKWRVICHSWNQMGWFVNWFLNFSQRPKLG